MDFSQKLQQLQKKEGLSQELLAERLQVSKQAISKWETGESMPDIENIIELSNIFSITTDTLLKDSLPLFEREENPLFDENFPLITTKVMNIGSAFLMAVGLILGIVLWSQFQNMLVIGIGLIVQLAGLVSFFFGRAIAKSMNQNEVPSKGFIMLLFSLGLFMPVSLIVSALFGHVPSPYPLFLRDVLAFAAIYTVSLLLIYLYLRRKNTQNP